MLQTIFTLEVLKKSIKTAKWGPLHFFFFRKVYISNIRQLLATWRHHEKSVRWCIGCHGSIYSSEISRLIFPLDKNIKSVLIHTCLLNTQNVLTMLKTNVRVWSYVHDLALRQLSGRHKTLLPGLTMARARKSRIFWIRTLFANLVKDLWSAPRERIPRLLLVRSLLMEGNNFVIRSDET